MAGRFGPAGNPESFYEAGYKKSLQIPEFLRQQGLDAYEYQCSRGVRVSEAMARELGALAKANNVRLSIHAPYYINLASSDPKIMESSKGHMFKSLEVAHWMEAKVVVFHPGGVAKMDRREGMDKALRLLQEILQEARERGYGHIYLAPETMGKQNQLGNLSEVLELCRLDKQVIPCVDFGHLHALTQGGFEGEETFIEALDEIEATMGAPGTFPLHMHYSPMEFTKAGEKRHRTLLDEGFGPDFAPLGKLLAQRGHDFTLICESAGRQSEDALEYQKLYRRWL